MDIEEYKKALKVIEMHLDEIISDNTILVVGEPVDGFKPMIYRFKCPFCKYEEKSVYPDQIHYNAKQHFHRCMKRKFARKKLMEMYPEDFE